MLKFIRRKHVAIDYDRREVRMVVFRYVRGRPVIVSLHRAEIPEGVDPSDAASLGKFIRTLIVDYDLDGARAVMCVGRSQAVLKSMTLPSGVSSDELASMVQYQVSRELPFAADEAVVDFTHGVHWDTAGAEADGEVTTVLAAAVRIPVIETAGRICDEAGLKLERLGLRPYANLRAVYRSVRCEPGERILLVNITADEAEIDVMRDESLEFSRSAAVTSPDDQAGPDVRRIVAEVTRSLQSFNATQPGAEIDAALVAGATGLEKDLVAALSESLSVRCELLDPAGGFAVQTSEAASSFAAALGLASTDIRGESLPFDFINPKRPAPPKNTRRIRAIAAAAVIVVLLGTGALAGTSHISRLKTNVNTLTEKKKNLLRTNKSLKRLRKRVRAVETWADADYRWLGQLAHFSATLPEAKALYLTGLDCSPGKVMLTGRVADSETVSRFAEKLMNMTGYEVRPKGTSAVRDKFGYAMQFRLEVLIAPDARDVITTSRPTENKERK
ncbi:MAG: pilus assembly protein PilM [Phycisphaerae bacterium]|nr:pilus assembly protein PilM [Phycisphaerae bacterium]